jgi:hypothetical protein
MGAQTMEPASVARLVPLNSTPLSSQLPPRQWPPVIALDEVRRNALIGDYRFGPDRIGRVFLHEGRLFAFMPGQGEAELFATSPTEFFVRVDPTAVVRFEGSRLIVRIAGREFVGERVTGR